MKRANSGLTWIRQKHVTAFLQELAVTPSVTHEAVDTLPKSRTREFVRGLLVEHGVLPHRDVYRARYDEWSGDALDRLTDPVNRDVIRRYIRWQHQRRINQMDPVSQGTFLRSKQTVTVAIELLNWLTDHGIDLGELEQEHLDAWQATGPSTRLIADRFLSWAIKTRLVGPDLKIQPHRRGTSPRMNAKDQEEAVQRVVHSDEFTPRDRAAAILVLVFGQQIEDVVGLTWDDINVTDELVTIQIGSVEIALPAPLDGPWRCLAANPGNDLTAAHPNSNWVFRATPPVATSTPATSAIAFARYSAHAPPGLARSTSSPSWLPWRSLPRRWATPPRPSSGTLSTRVPPTPATLQRYGPRSVGRADGNAVPATGRSRLQREKRRRRSGPSGHGCECSHHGPADHALRSGRLPPPHELPSLPVNPSWLTIEGSCVTRPADLPVL
jgi:hypothetical protein